MRSIGVPRFGYYPIYGWVGCISCWVFITPWCGMGFCSTIGGGCCTYCCGGYCGAGDARGRVPFLDSFIHLKSKI
jgi:hypothetical protein